MSRLSETEWSSSSTSDSSDSSSDISEDEFVSANENFQATEDTPELSDSVFDYSGCVEVVEPIATQEEAETYAENLAREEEEEEILWSRFSGEENVENWCSCNNCSLEHVATFEECWCCMDIHKCREEMEMVDQATGCITNHPGYEEVCLNEWVLRAASIGLKTKSRKSYMTVFARGETEKNEFMRSVAYRQFVRLVWKYVGASKRIPLPCCVYNSIRKCFPTDAKQFKGFEDED